MEKLELELVIQNGEGGRGNIADHSFIHSCSK
jgi:hypothetical protein